MQNDQSRKELMTAAEAAEHLKIAKRTLLRWARENKIESVKLSRKVILFTAEGIDEFLQSRSRKVEPAPTNHRGAGRKTASRKSTKKGGGKKTSGESSGDLRKEVLSWL
jgi:excisionase family DNA binding protein